MLEQYSDLQKRKEEYFRILALKRKNDEDDDTEHKKSKETNVVCKHAKYSKYVLLI